MSVGDLLGVLRPPILTGVRLSCEEVTGMTDGLEETRRRVLLGAAGFVTAFAGCSSSDGGTESSPANEQATTTTSVSPSISANDQTTDGSFVVARAVIDRSGWIGVHPSSANGGMKPNSHVGHAKLSAGRHEEVRAAIEPPLDEGGTLYVVLHYDDPADGELTYPDGDPAVTVGGNPVRASFELTVET